MAGLSAGGVELTVNPNLSGFGAKLNAELKGVKGGAGLSALENNLGKPIDGLKSKISALGGLLGGAVVVGGFRKVIGETVEWGGEIKKLVRQTGLATESASGLALEAHHFGLDVDTLSRGLGIFQKHLVANDKQFQSLGISVKDAHGNLIPFDQILAKTSAVFQKLPDGPQKTALALNLFGRNGKALLPFLSAGPEAMRKFSEEAKHLGLSLSGDNLRTITNYQFATRDFSASLKGLEVQLGLRVLPVLSGFFHIASLGLQVLGRIPTPVLGAAAAFAVFVGAVSLANRFAGAAHAALASIGTGFRALVGDSAASTAALEAHATAAGAVVASDAAAATAGLGLQVAALKEATAVDLAAAAAERSALANATAGEQALATAIALQQEAAAAGEVAVSASASGGGFLAMAAGAARVFAPIAIILGGLTAMHHFQNQGKKDAEEWAQALAAAAGTGQTAIDKLTNTEKDLAAQFQALQAKHGGARGLIFSGDAAAADVLYQRLKAVDAVLRQLGIDVDAGGDPLSKIKSSLQGTIDFQNNLKQLVAEGVPQQVADQLKSMGQDGQDAAAELVDGTAEERAQFTALVQETLPPVEQKLRQFFGMTRTEFKSWTDSLTSGFNFIQSDLSSLASSLSEGKLAGGVASAQKSVTAATNAEAAARDRLAVFEAKLHEKKTVTASDLVREKQLQDALSAAQEKAKGAAGDLATAQSKLSTSAQQVLNSFSDSLKAEQDYDKNFGILLKRNLPADFVKQLADMGAQGAPLVSALATANKTQFNAIVAKWQRAEYDSRHLAQAIYNNFTNKKINIPVHIKVPSKSEIADARNAIREKLEGGLPVAAKVDANLSSMSVDAATVNIFANAVEHHAAGGFAPLGRVASFGEKGPEIGLPGYNVLPADISARIMSLVSGQSGGSSGPTSAPVPESWREPRAHALNINGDINIVNQRPKDSGESVTRALKTLQLLLET